MRQLSRAFQSVVIFVLASNLIVVVAQAPPRRSRPTLNQTIASIVREIDARNIEASIRKLVSFGTRNTLSEQNDPNRGIGAARDWLYAEFQKVAQSSKGRMTVEKQSYEQPKAPRIPQLTVITNVVATLKGSQAESADRIYVVSGHYDSMCNSPTDAKCDAPGANDDASGTAAVLEMARVMSKYEFDATIVFMAVAGEEQSLLGSTYYADQAKQKNWNIDAMFTNDIIGNTLGGNGVRDRGTVRVFAEGVPSNETPAEANIRRSVGGENDSAARQLARFIKETSEAFVPRMKVMLVYRRDRYGRGGDHIPFLERGYPAVRFTEVNEEFRHQHQNVRVENGIQYGDLPEVGRSRLCRERVDRDPYLLRFALISTASETRLPRVGPRRREANPPASRGLSSKPTCSRAFRLCVRAVRKVRPRLTGPGLRRRPRLHLQNARLNGLLR